MEQTRPRAAPNVSMVRGMNPNRADIPLAYDKTLLPTPLHEVEGLHAFLREHTLIPALKKCSPWSAPCYRLICPRCAHERSKALRAEWLDRIDPNAPALMVRLSVVSSSNLSQGYSDLVRTRRRFGKRSWLTSASDGWMRNTEVTFHKGLWHFHDHMVILAPRDALRVVQKEISTRWHDAARSAGVRASPRQYVKPARSTEASKVYLLKGLMAPASDANAGRTPGDLLRAWHMGDADAAEAWAQLEQFFLTHPRGVILSQRGGDLRAKADYALTA